MTEKTRKKSFSKKRSTGWKIVRFLGIFFFVIVLLLVTAVFALDFYLQSNKAKIFEQLPFLNNGSITFDEAEISIYKNFPSATISLKNILVKDSIFPQHQIPFLKAGEFRAALSLKKLWEEEVELKSIELHDGQLNLHTDSSGYKLFRALIPQPSKSTTSNKNNSLLKDFKFRVNPLDVSLYNVYIKLTNVAKKSSIQGNAEQLFAQLHFNDSSLTAAVDMQIALKEMTFNKDKGTFLKDSKLVGKPVIHLKNGLLSFDTFDIKINEEQFTFHGVYDTKKETISKLVLENNNTRWEKITPLLTDSINMHITPFFIQNPFYTKTIIKGKFLPGQPVTVDIDFLLEENEVKVFQFDLNKTNLKGRFVSRFFDNRLDEQQSRKGFTLEVQQLATDFQGLQVRTQNALIAAPRKTVPKVDATIQVLGDAEDISNWLSNEQFFFDDGYFDLFAQINGPIDDYNQLMIKSDASLELNDIDVYYKPADVVFPFHRLTLSKRSGDANFQLLSSTPRERRNFQIVGLLNNLPALLIKLKDQRARSQGKFAADKITWQDFLDWFGEKGYLKRDETDIEPKSEEQKKRTMKQTIRGIHNKFQPRLSLNIDTLTYYDLLQIDNFFMNVYFEDENHLVLEKTSFDYEKGSVKFNARLDISDSLQTPFEFELHTKKLNLEKLLPPFNHFNIKLLANLEQLPTDLNLSVKLSGIIDDRTGLMPNTTAGSLSFDIDDGELLAGKISFESKLTLAKDTAIENPFTNTKILLVGDPSIFNDFLKTDEFFFSKGRFFFTFDYSDDQANLQNILDSSDATLKIQNSSVHYKLTGVDFPLTEIDLFLKSGDADFDLLIRSDSLQKQIQLTGIIQNISELVIGNTGKSIKTIVDVKSPKIIWDQFFHLFVPESTVPKKQEMHNVKATLIGIFNQFDPTLSAQIDTLVLTDKFTVMNFHSGIHMADYNKLVLEETAFNFYDGRMGVEGQFDFNSTGPLPFAGNFYTKDVDVEKLLISLDYIGLPSLQNIEKLSGQITMDLGLSGLIAEDGEDLIHEATKGLLDVQLNDVELRGMPTLDSLTSKVRMKERFAEIRFAPIENRFTIDGQNIEIPLMEIQSNAINLFMEGILSYGDQTNIWITIPLDNLKKADRSIVPQKRGYAATKSKVFIEVTSDEAGNNKFKLRTSKRKFYKHRGITSQYRKDKRKYRKIRKDIKKQTRK